MFWYFFSVEDGSTVFHLSRFLVLWFFFHCLTAYFLMTMGKKLNHSHTWFAWIPFAQFFMYPMLAKKHWIWNAVFFIPVLFFIAGFLSFILCLDSLAYQFHILSLLFLSVAFFITVWMTWEIYRRRNYPGWLSLFKILSPVLPFFYIANMVLLGIVALKDRN